MKKQCNECKRDFSEDLISPLKSNFTGQITFRNMCPICALEIINKESGIPADTPFRGPKAIEKYKRALAEVELMRREKK